MLMRSTSNTQRTQPILQTRCGIYCRKSHLEGLEQDFNSLDAQRDACEAYIASQSHSSWVALEQRYDDGGVSGGTLDRPALQRLLHDVESGRVDCIVLYRLDRLSRSLTDFAKLVDLFDQHEVAFASVTEQLCTATPTGRLHLHMILSFAQYEREVIAERIRDKVAAAKRRGMHCGGMPVLGFDTVDRKLVVNAEEATLVRHIFERFRSLGSATTLAKELNERGHRTKEWKIKTGATRGGRSWNKSHIYRLLNNRKYIGEVEHRGEVYDGEHDAIVERELWDDVQAILRRNRRARGNESRGKNTALLREVIRCAHCDSAMTSSFTTRHRRRYFYYRCASQMKTGESCPIGTIAAAEVEDAVVDQLRAVFRTPEIIAKTYHEGRVREAEEIDRLRDLEKELAKNLKALREKAKRLLDADVDGNGTLAEELQVADGDLEDLKQRLKETRADLRTLEAHSLTEADVIAALEKIDPVWAQLFPKERARIIDLLVSRVDVRPDSLEVRIRAEGLRSLVAELADDDGDCDEAVPA